MRLTPKQEAAYSLDYAVSRADLKPEVQAEYDRLLAERRAAWPGQAAHDPPELVEPTDWLRGANAYFWIMMMLAVLAFAAVFAVMAVNTKYNYQTLRADLDPVRLPSGYRLVTVSQSRNCSGCWLIETSTWSGNDGRTASAACSDVYHAMAAAYPPSHYGSLEGNPPQDMPAGTVCDYFTVKVGPGFNFTKIGIEAFVRKTQSADGVIVQLIASSDCYNPLSRTADC